MQQPQYLPKTALILLALTIGVSGCNRNPDRVFAQTTPASPATLQCTETQIETSINRLGEGDTAAFNFLVTCNSQAVPTLIKLLKHQDENIRIVAIAILGEIGEGATDAIPFLEEVLKDRREENEDSRLVVVDALGKMGQAAVPALIAAFKAALKHENSGVREESAWALGQIGEEAKDAVPDLIVALKDEDSQVRSSATSALGQIKIRQEAKEAVPALITALKDPDKIVRFRAAKALGQIGKEAKDAVPALIAALKDQDYWVRSNAASALGQIGKPAIPALIAALKDQDSWVRFNAASALRQIGKPAIPALIAALKDENSEVRSQAAWTLGQIGEEAKDAVPYLIAAFNDEDYWVRSNAASALGQIGKPAIPALIAALKDENSIFALKDQDYWVRSQAALVLGKIGKEAKEAVPELTLVVMTDECRETRGAAIEALRQIAPDEVVSLPASIAEVKGGRMCSFSGIGLTPEKVARRINSYQTINPPVMCQFLVVKAILSWKCPETNNNSSPSQSRDSNSPSSQPCNSNRSK